VSKPINGRYKPDRRTWIKIKCPNRKEFVVVGWSDPEGSRHWIGALLLGYYTPHGHVVYAGRLGTGIPEVELGHSNQVRYRSSLRSAGAEILGKIAPVVARWRLLLLHNGHSRHRSRDQSRPMITFATAH
jgi:hypothetical protein